MAALDNFLPSKSSSQFYQSYTPTHLPMAPSGGQVTAIPPAAIEVAKTLPYFSPRENPTSPPTSRAQQYVPHPPITRPTESILFHMTECAH
jgi:hypothetical protein